MKVKSINLERVEGTARLELVWKDGFIEDARVSFPYTRGIERVLKDRPYMDALVITPRVCGICGHAHLIACVRALEKAMGIEPTLKASLVRNITQSFEILQNHIKWFYLFILPEFLQDSNGLRKLYEPFKGRRWFLAIRQAAQAVKAIALFSGQWPHSSYAVPGGITSNPKPSDLAQLEAITHQIRDFFLKQVVGLEEEELRRFLEGGSLSLLKGDLGLFLEFAHKEGLFRAGRAYNRLLSGGELYNPSGFYCKKTYHGRIKPSALQELTPPSYSTVSPLRYRSFPYETGPLSRQLLSGNRFIKNLHREYGDSFMVRVVARVLEIWHILSRIEEGTKRLYECLHEPSTSLKKPPHVKRAYGYAFVEAARGTLMHEVEIEEGLIKRYRIITPSQWNLGPRCERFLGVAERAIVGLESERQAMLVLRSFDLCSVCTTR
jgi:Ni,Fe-hydrogenase I large subunit